MTEADAVWRGLGDRRWSGRPFLARALGVAKAGTRAVLSVLLCEWHQQTASLRLVVKSSVELAGMGVGCGWLMILAVT